MKEEGKVRVYLTDKFVLTGFGLAAIYWVLDSFLYIFLAYDVQFLHQALGFNLNEIWTRVVVCCLFVIFGSHAQYSFNLRLKAENALKSSEDRYRTIIESIEDGYYEIDTNGNFTFFNNAMCKIIGYDPQSLPGINIRRTMDAENANNAFEIFRQVQRTGKPTRAFDSTIIRKDGTRRFVEFSVSLLKHTNLYPFGFRGIIRDVTEKKQAEAAIQAQMAAESASRSKSEFLANMSHEIRTPLNSITGLTEMLLDTELTPDQREDLEIVMSASYSLLALINDILDFSKIEAGKLELEETSFSLRDFIGESLKIVAIKTHEKGIELAYRVPPDIPDRMIGDSSRFRQILLNLVGNAVKFTDTGEIIVSVSRLHQTENDIELQFAVKDTGIGIPREKQKTIFSAFQQADGSTSRRYGGTGLGLTVSSQLVALMGGRIWLESEPKKGSTFFFTMHFKISSQEIVTSSVQPDEIRGKRVLVVDNNQSNRQILQELLEGWGMTAVTAANAKEALQILSVDTHAEKSFSTVLLDADMPESDGFAIAQWIESTVNKPIDMIMMLTLSSQMNRIKKECPWIRETITKPIRPSDLLDVLIRSLCLTEVTVSTISRQKRNVPDNDHPFLKILVAEDTPFNQKFIKRLLGRWGHQSTVVDNGRLALEALAQNDFDLVLMDVQMPEMDGFEATAQIRAGEVQSGRHIPIIAMTAHAMKGDREKCISSGMDEYISKPISIDSLHEIIARLFPIDSKVDTEGRSLPDDLYPSSPSFDKESLLSAFDNDWDFLKETVEMFINDYPPLLEDIQSAIFSNNASQLGQTAHALKGMVGNFQAGRAASAAAALEELGRQEDFENVDKFYEILKDEMQRLEKSLLALLQKV